MTESPEFMRDLTPKRRLRVPELGIRPGVIFQNWAVGFYNSVGAYMIGQAWKDLNLPEPSALQFAAGTVVAKILFTAARPEDFAGTPVWDANIFKSSGSTEKEIQTLHLPQMDVAIRDERAGLLGSNDGRRVDMGKRS